MLPSTNRIQSVSHLLLVFADTLQFHPIDGLVPESLHGSLLELFDLKYVRRKSNILL